ncbi:MAG TPA: DCC1-like thiol-disulfide oxidoreductase family protein [Solirubrobacterales bacterium]
MRTSRYRYSLVDKGPDQPGRASVLYDADCGFCRWSLAKLLAWDRGRRLRPVAIDSTEGGRLLSTLNDEKRVSSWHLIGPDGRRHSAGAAAAPLLRTLSGGAPLAALLERFPSATEGAYAWVAAHRSRLGRLIPAAAKRRADARIRRRS